MSQETIIKEGKLGDKTKLMPNYTRTELRISSNRSRGGKNLNLEILVYNVIHIYRGGQEEAQQ